MLVLSGDYRLYVWSGSWKMGLETVLLRMIGMFSMIQIIDGINIKLSVLWLDNVKMSVSLLDMLIIYLYLLFYLFFLLFFLFFLFLLVLLVLLFMPLISIAAFHNFQIQQVQQHNPIIFLNFSRLQLLILPQKVRQSFPRWQCFITMMIVPPKQWLIIFQSHIVLKSPFL